jgi:RNA polymerase sigma-70 factor, ECF subfamily
MTATSNYSASQAPPVSSATVDGAAATGVDTATLVLMVKSKSGKGFNILYDNYCGALYGILMKFVQHTDVADDLLQDIFLKIWKHIDRFDAEKGSLYTWMLNIARNQAIDYLRSSHHQQQSLHVDNEFFSLHGDCVDASASISNVAEFKDLQKKALQLDAKYAEVIDMIFFYGCTHEQTARIMKLPLGTVKTRARKGLNMLKTLYQQ